MVRGSHEAKLASPVGFLLQIGSEVSGHGIGAATALGLTWTQLLLGFLLLPGGAGTGAASVTRLSEGRKWTEGNPGS